MTANLLAGFMNMVSLGSRKILVNYQALFTHSKIVVNMKALHLSRATRQTSFFTLLQLFFTNSYNFAISLFYQYSFYICLHCLKSNYT